MTVDRNSLAYDVRGAGDRTLLLLHGFPMNRSVWSGVIDTLGDGVRTAAIDLPGFGESSLQAGWTVDSLAEQLLSLATSQHWGRLTVAGLSMGGYVALAMAARSPDALAGLILVDSRTDADTAEQKQNRDRLIQIAQIRGRKAIADEMQGKLLSPATVRTSPHIVRAARAMMESVDPAASIAALMAMRERPDRTTLLPTLTIPVGVIVGEDDVPSPPDVAHRMIDRVADGWVEVIPDAGHLAAMEQPVAVARAIRAHLERSP